MPEDVPRGTQSLDRALDLFTALAGEGGARPLGEIAGAIGMSVPTAHRLAAHLCRRGWLIRTGRGCYAPGFALFGLAARRAAAQVAAAAARPLLRRLARDTGRTAHLGLFDGEMVTYLVREAAPGGHVFTREAMQLEAYCSGIGKMLLAMHSEAERVRYAASGGFVPLTARTITDGTTLLRHLRQAAADGFAVDDEEVEEELFCLAVPIALPLAEPKLALSLAGPVPPADVRADLLAKIRATATQLAASLGAR